MSDEAHRLKYDAPQGTGRFELHDPEPHNHHSGLYLVDPNGAMFNISCWDEEGLDKARGEWMCDTLNAALIDDLYVEARNQDDDGDTSGSEATLKRIVDIAGAADRGVLPSLELCVQFSDDGQHIRRWSRCPFDGCERLYSHPATNPLVGFVQMVAALAGDELDAHASPELRDMARAALTTTPTRNTSQIGEG